MQKKMYFNKNYKVRNELAFPLKNRIHLGNLKKQILGSLLLVLLLLPYQAMGTGTEEKSHKVAAPDFYRGIYLNNGSARSMKRIDYFIQMAQKYKINSFVMDVQVGRKSKESMVSAEAVEKIKNAGIWPIARVVVFDQGFIHYPIPESIIQNRISVAEKAVQNGFGEIQFDYIRFADNHRLRQVKMEERYKVVEGFLERAGKVLKPKGIVISADIYGRIPLNQNDLIGQRMEGLAKVAHIISPMAYPSHYTWSKKLMSDPYHTVYITSKQGHDRVKGQAQIVTWIQGFKLKVGYSRLSLKNYIKEQIRAVEKAGVRGFLIWNAGQHYQESFQALNEYYQQSGKDTKKVEK
jgi:hypothetical protein